MKELIFTVDFLVRLSWRTDRRRLLTGGSLLLLGYAATPVIAVALKHLVDSALAGDPGTAARWAALAGIALIGELQLGHFAHLFYFELAEVNELRLNLELQRLVNGTDTLDALDDPAFADALTLMRQDVMRMRECVSAALQLAGLLVQVALTAVLLARVQAWLLLLPLVAVLPVLLGRRAEQVLLSGREAAAPMRRQVARLRELATSPQAQKEIRISGAAEHLLRRHDSLLASADRILRGAQRRHGLLRAAGQAAFALAYVVSVGSVVLLAGRGEASAGDVVLLVTLATQISTQVASGLELLAALHVTAAGFRRLEALRAAAAEPSPGRKAPDGTRLDHGLVLEGVRFHYPGAAGSDADLPGAVDVLRGVDLRLPAGTSVALVGENGAGKSTLIKLLSGLHVPTAGRILVDGEPLAAVDPAGWRERTASLFQDFARLELTAQESVGVGWLPEIGESRAVEAAFGRARAGQVLAELPDGVGTLLGKAYGDGRDLSGGQWQGVGFARTLMRQEPLLLCLDEPGHSLDALAEERMCEAYDDVSRDLAARVGSVTVFVTHRLSTIRLADLIVVLHDGRVAEVGSHAELTATGGRYAQLFALQARGYG